MRGELERWGNDWFAVQVWTSREHLSAKHLVARRYEVFLPCYLAQRKWSDRIKNVERALFAGYIFCRLSAETLANVVTAPGVVCIVGDGCRPLPVASEEIERLKCVVSQGLRTEPWEYLRSGQTVRVRRGPLKDVEGIFVKTTNRHRLVITVTLLQRAVAVEIDPAWVDIESREASDPALGVNSSGGSPRLM